MYEVLVKEKAFFREGTLREREIQNGIFIQEGLLSSSNTMLFSSQAYKFDSVLFNDRWVKNWLKSNKIQYKFLREDMNGS